jgi:hypothetical protein
MDSLVVGNLIELKDLFDFVHQIDELNGGGIVSAKSFTKEKNGHELMLSIRFPGVFAGIKRQMGKSEY